MSIKAPFAGAVLAAAFLTSCYSWQRLGDNPADTPYYSDLGPAWIDVSRYPPEQQRNYKTFVAVCGRCHTLARAVNSPTESRLYWRFHLARMNLHSRLTENAPLSRQDVADILDFLDYDSRVRKIQDRKHFEALTENLKKRFDPILRKQLRRLGTGAPSDGAGVY